MADKIRCAMHGNRGKRERAARLLCLLVAAVALFAATAGWAAAEGEGKVQGLSLTWNAVQNNPEAGAEVAGSSLSLTPQGATTQASGTSASAHLTFTVANANSDNDIQPNELEVRIPAHIFFDRAGNAVGTFGIGLVDSIDQTNAENYFYYEWDRATDEIVIKNGQPIQDNVTFDADFTWSSVNDANDPHAVGASASGARNIKDGYVNDAIKAKATLSQGSVTETVETDVLSVSYHTSSEFEIKKEARSWQTVWDENWGTDPDPEGAYVYTIWKVNVSPDSTATQPYTLTVADEPQALEDGTEGVVVYNSLAGANAEDPSKASWTVDPASTDDAPGQEIYYVVRYPRPEDNKGFKTKNKTVGTLDPVDHDPVTHEAEAKLDISTLGFTYPGAGPGIYKTSYETHREGAINAIKDARVGDQPAVLDELRYTNSATMRGGALTLGKDAEGNSLDAGDIDNYGKRAYTVELTDDLLMLGEDRLEDGDYTIRQITVATRKESKYVKDEKTGTYRALSMSAGEWCTADPETGEKPAADVYVRLAGSSGYEFYGTVKYDVDSANATSVSIAKSHFVQDGASPQMVAAYNAVKPAREWYGNYNLPLNLPENTAGVQVRWQSKNYDTSLSSVALVRLSVTDHLKEIVEKPGQDAQLSLVNVNSLRVFDADGAWWKPADSAGENIDGTLANEVLKRDEREYGEAHKNAFHAYAADELLSYTGGTSISKGGRSLKNDADADSSTSAKIKFSYNAQTRNYEGLYYVDAADWTSVSSKDATLRNEDQVRRSGRVHEQTEGTFYDLLPEGMTVDASSVKAWEKELEADESNNTGTPDMAKVAHSYAWREQNDSTFRQDRCDVSVEAKQNWRGTGRTMLIAHVAGKGANLNKYGPYGISDSDKAHVYWYSGFHLEFNAYYSREAYADHGSAFTNSVAYMGKEGSTLWDGYADSTDDVPVSLKINDAALMNDLDGDGNAAATANVVYAQEDTQLTSEGSAQAESNKRVMDEHDTTWKTDTVTTQDGSYRYRLRMVAANDLNDLVFYDDIERHVDTPDIASTVCGRWTGTFAGLELNNAKRLGIEPVVYYSTRDDLDIYTDATGAENPGTDRDLMDASVWTEAGAYVAAGGKLSDVKAVAVDMSCDKDGNPVTVRKGQSISIYVDMLAPTDPVLCKKYHDEGYRAVNRWTMSSTSAQTGAHKLLPIRPVTVRINAKTADLGFSKVDGSGSGAPLAGAKFALLRWTGDGDAPSDGVVDAAHPGAGWEVVGSATSADDGSVAFADLVKGTYRLIETKAPGDYQLPSGQWQIAVDPAADAGVGEGKQFQIAAVAGSALPPAFAVADDGALSLPNYRASALPTSGALGLAGLVIGALAIAGAGWVLVRGGNREG